MQYDLEVSHQAEASLRRLPSEACAAVALAMHGLRDVPRPAPPRGKPLTHGLKGIWRLRVRHYRVLYEIDDAARVVRVLDIADRRDAYGGH